MGVNGFSRPYQIIPKNNFTWIQLRNFKKYNIIMYLDIRNEQNGWKPPITTQDALVIFYLLQVWDLSL